MLRSSTVTRAARARTIAVIGFVIGSVWGVAAPAIAAPPLSKVTGPVTGTTSYALFGTCGFVRQVYDLTLTRGRSRAASIKLDGCVNPVLPDFVFGGNFTLTEHGNSVTGTVTGTINSFSATRSCSTGIPIDLDFVLTPDGGHGAHRDDNLVFRGVWCSQNDSPAVNDPVTGELVAT
jgi:hypothetical protein